MSELINVDVLNSFSASRLTATGHDIDAGWWREFEGLVDLAPEFYTACQNAGIDLGEIEELDDNSSIEAALAPLQNVTAEDFRYLHIARIDAVIDTYLCLHRHENEKAIVFVPKVVGEKIPELISHLAQDGGEEVFLDYDTSSKDEIEQVLSDFENGRIRLLFIAGANDKVQVPVAQAVFVTSVSRRSLRDYLPNYLLRCFEERGEVPVDYYTFSDDESISEFIDSEEVQQAA